MSKENRGRTDNIEEMYQLRDESLNLLLAGDGKLLASLTVNAAFSSQALESQQTVSSRAIVAGLRLAVATGAIEFENRKNIEKDRLDYVKRVYRKLLANRKVLTGSPDPETMTPSDLRSTLAWFDQIESGILEYEPPICLQPFVRKNWEKALNNDEDD